MVIDPKMRLPFYARKPVSDCITNFCVLSSHGIIRNAHGPSAQDTPYTLEWMCVQHTSKALYSLFNDSGMDHSSLAISQVSFF